MSREQDYTLAQLAESLQMSERWIRQRIAAGAKHQRYGRKIMFTARQVEEPRSAHTVSIEQIPLSITSGKKRRTW